jgi:hypothetical protein
MDHLIGISFRIGKALLLGALMYYSLRMLNFSMSASLTFALVPAILGSLNIVTRLAFTLTAIVFIIASASMLLKDRNFRVGMDDVTGLFRPLLITQKPTDESKEKKLAP